MLYQLSYASPNHLENRPGVPEDLPNLGEGTLPLHALYGTEIKVSIPPRGGQTGVAGAGERRRGGWMAAGGWFHRGFVARKPAGGGVEIVWVDGVAGGSQTHMQNNIFLFEGDLDKALLDDGEADGGRGSVGVAGVCAHVFIVRQVGEIICKRRGRKGVRGQGSGVRGQGRVSWREKRIRLLPG